MTENESVEFWCKNQISCDGKLSCIAHLAEDRILLCPYKSSEERLGKLYPCSDYEPVEAEKEYIEREAAVAALQPKHAPALNRAFEAMIRSVPAADVRPVVTCSKCKYNDRCLLQGFVRTERLLPFNADTWFCPDGERKEDG